MRNVILILVLLFFVANTVDMGEELMKREILTKIVEYAGIEMPHEYKIIYQYLVYTCFACHAN